MPVNHRLDPSAAILQQGAGRAKLCYGRHTPLERHCCIWTTSPFGIASWRHCRSKMVNSLERKINEYRVNREAGRPPTIFSPTYYFLTRGGSGGPPTEANGPHTHQASGQSTPKLIASGSLSTISNPAKEIAEARRRGGLVLAGYSTLLLTECRPPLLTDGTRYDHTPLYPQAVGAGPAFQDTDRASISQFSSFSHHGHIIWSGPAPTRLSKTVGVYRRFWPAGHLHVISAYTLACNNI